MNFGVSMEINKETLITNINISDEEKDCLERSKFFTRSVEQVAYTRVYYEKSNFNA